MFRQRMHMKTFIQRTCATEVLVEGGDAEPSSGEPDIFIVSEGTDKACPDFMGKKRGRREKHKKISPEERVLEPIGDRMVVWDMTIPEHT